MRLRYFWKQITGRPGLVPGHVADGNEGTRARDGWFFVAHYFAGVANAAAPHSLCGSLLNPSCSQCRSKANAVRIPRSRITTKATQSVRE